MKASVYNDLEEGLKEKITAANVFFQKEYAVYLDRLGDRLVYVYDKERIISVRLRDKLIFHFAVLLSEPFDLTGDLTSSLSFFLDGVIEFLEKEYRVQWVNTTASGLFPDTVSHGCKRIPFGSHIVGLTLSEDELWRGVHSKHRNVIRSAIKKGITIKTGHLDLIRDYVLMEKDTSKRTGRHASGTEYYTDQIGLMPNVSVVYIAYYGDIPQAGGIFYYNDVRCYYMYGAMARNAVNGAANLLIWRAMLDMKAAGVKEFSFVGCRINEDVDSKYHGIQRFKERFGGVLRQGFLFRYERWPYLYRLFCRAMQIRMQLEKPYSDPIDEEIHKWTDIQV